MTKGIKNIGASVRARLLNLSNANGQRELDPGGWTGIVT